MRSILLHIHDDPCLDARMELALDLARAFHGHLSCLQALPFEFGVPGDIYGAMASELNPVFRQNAMDLQTALEARLERQEIPWDWIVQNEIAQRQLLVHSCLNDVIVMGACTDQKGHSGYSALAAEITIGARAPVLLVPDECSGLDLSAPVIIAWNGSPEVASVLRSAVPMLKKSREVCLLTVTDDKPSFKRPAIEAASYLARHDINPTIIEMPPSGNDIGKTVMRAALAREAGWIAMGAYGHSRMRERLLGGVSRSLMTAPHLPILMAH